MKIKEGRNKIKNDQKVPRDQNNKKRKNKGNKSRNKQNRITKDPFEEKAETSQNENAQVYITFNEKDNRNDEKGQEVEIVEVE